MNIKKSLFNLTKVAKAATLVAGVSIAADAVAEDVVTVWHGYRGSEKNAFEKVIANFNKQGDRGFTVNSLGVPYDAYSDKITAAVPRGRGPDVFIYAQDRLGGWVEAGNTMEAIDFYLDEDVRNQYIPATMKAMVYRDTTYGLPLNYKVITMIYNKKLVPTPPTTSKELVDLAQKLTDKASGKYGLAYSYADFYYHAMLMNAFGGKVFEPGPKAVLVSKENLSALDYLLGWMNEGILPTEPSTSLITTLFNTGKTAIVFSGPWFLGEISPDVDFGLAPLPNISEAEDSPMRPWITVEGVYISSQSQLKDQAFEVLFHLTSPESGKVMAVEGRQTPANIMVYDYPEVADDAILGAFRKQVEVAIPMPNQAEMTMVWSPATTAMNMIVKGAATPKAAFTKAQKSVDRAVAGLRIKR
jgi:arabinogalactan oligomer/maltooligosaccharide transport system substrate-binding protein